MNTDELLVAIREHAHLSDSDPDYTDAVLLRAANAEQLTVFTQIVTSSRTERWVHKHDTTAESGRAEYRIYRRALMNGLRDIKYSKDGTHFWDLDPWPLDRIHEWDGVGGEPEAFVLRGDTLHLVPAPNQAGTLRQYFYMRPPTLIAFHDGGTIADFGGLLVISGDLPSDPGDGSTLEIGDTVDIVHPNGGYELAAYDATVVDPGTATEGIDAAANPLAEVGDYVTFAGYSYWPMLPEEMHDILAWAVSAKILIEKGQEAEAQAAIAKTSDGIRRAIDMLTPRVKGAAPILVNRNSRLRRRWSRPRWRHA